MTYPVFTLTTDKGGLPELCTPIQKIPGIVDIVGATRDCEYNIYRYPWYWPLNLWVMHDLEVLARALNCTTPDLLHKSAFDLMEIQRKHLDLYQKRESPVELPENFFVYEPYTHQWDGMLFGAMCWRLGWLYEMGLGKTKLAIDTIRLRQLLRGTRMKYLIITPPPVIDTFRSEIDLHSRNTLSHGAFWGKKRADVLQQDLDVVLTTYETLLADTEPLVSAKFDGIVADESHKFRNWTTQTAKAVMKVAENIPWRAIMSGSAGSDPRHWYAQLLFQSKALVPEGSYSNFCKKFLRYSPRNRYIVEGFKSLDRLQERINRTCITKYVHECLDLPEKTLITKTIPLSGKIIEIYNDMFAEGKATINNSVVALPYDLPIVQMQALMQITRGWINESQRDPFICDNCPQMYQCIQEETRPYSSKCRKETVSPPPITHTIEADNPILAAAVSDMVDIITNNPSAKIIAWFRSNETLRRCAALFVQRRAGTYNMPDENVVVDNISEDTALPSYDTQSVARIGDEHVIFTSGANYKQLVDKFETDPSIRVCFGQIKCGIGVNLTAAAYTMYVEPTMSIDDYRQSEARFYRPGQKQSVVVIRYVAEGTFDGAINTMLDQKENIEKALQDPKFCDRCIEHGSCLLGLKSHEKSGTRDNNIVCGMRKFIRRATISQRKLVSTTALDDTLEDIDDSPMSVPTELDPNAPFVYDFDATII